MKIQLFSICIFILIHHGFCQDLLPSPERKLNAKEFGVGFKSFLLYDLSRPPLKEQLDINPNAKGRVIQINLWYPTTKSNRKKLLFKDYLILKGGEIDTALTDERKEFIAKSILSKNYNTSIDTISLLFKSKCEFAGIQDAAFLSEKFPLLVLMHNDPVGFASLAEYITRLGFIVVNFPLSGTTSKNFDWETIAGIETELSDMNFVVKEITKMSIADSTCIIPLGYSYGAMAAVAYQMRNKNVKAIISLDGGIGSIWGGNMLFNLPGFNISLLNKPIFHAWSDLDDGYNHKWLHNYICCDRYLMKFSKLRHGDFVEGLLFEKIISGITSNVLGKIKEDNDRELNKLIESIAYFALWIKTGNQSYESKLIDSNLPFSKLKKRGCT